MIILLKFWPFGGVISVSKYDFAQILIACGENIAR